MSLLNQCPNRLRALLTAVAFIAVSSTLFGPSTAAHAAPSDDLTVVILTGLGSTPEDADNIKAYLSSPMLGYNVKVYPALHEGWKWNYLTNFYQLDENFSPIPEGIDLLAFHFALWVGENVTTSRIALVAHSMGGLIARKYVNSYDHGQKVEKVILSGTANYGTTLAYPGSDYTINGTWLNKLNKGDISIGAVQYWSLMTQWDNVVTPFENQWLPRLCLGTNGITWETCSSTASGQGVATSSFVPQLPYVAQPIEGAGFDPQVTNVILQAYCPYSLTQHIGFRDKADAQDVVRQALDGVTDITSVNCSSRPRPIGSFTASVTSGVAPLAVSFDASASRDSDGYVDKYEWKFGDDTTGSGAIVSHTYSSAGTYTVRLTVRDEWGTPSVSVAKTIKIN